MYKKLKEKLEKYFNLINYKLGKSLQDYLDSVIIFFPVLALTFGFYEIINRLINSKVNQYFEVYSDYLGKACGKEVFYSNLLAIYLVVTVLLLVGFSLHTLVTKNFKNSAIHLRAFILFARFSFQLFVFIFFNNSCYRNIRATYTS
ncbi:hypothetical protein ABSA28_00776 [Candidatus Hepatincolaceae symbiont of Richtersius coronifer]